VLKGYNHPLLSLFERLKGQGCSLFEAFIACDVNCRFELSRVELLLGLERMEVKLEPEVFARVWRSFRRNERDTLSFEGWFMRFVEAGAVVLLDT